MNYNEFKIFIFAAMDTEIELERQQQEKKKTKETNNTTQLKYISDYLNKKRAKNKKKKLVQPI